jgi:hypothetical protein
MTLEINRSASAPFEPSSWNRPSHARYGWFPGSANQPATFAECVAPPVSKLSRQLVGSVGDLLIVNDLGDQSPVVSFNHGEGPPGEREFERPLLTDGPRQQPRHPHPGRAGS